MTSDAADQLQEINYFFKLLCFRQSTNPWEGENPQLILKPCFQGHII